VSPAAITGSGKVDPAGHVEFEPPVGVHVSPEQRGERVQVSCRQPPFPLGPGEHLLDHEGVHVDHAVLQQVQAEHAQLLVLAPVAGHLAAAGEEDEVIGAVPLLDDVQPIVDLAPERLVGEVAGQESCLHSLSKL